MKLYFLIMCDLSFLHKIKLMQQLKEKVNRYLQYCNLPKEMLTTKTVAIKSHELIYVERSAEPINTNFK